MFPYVSTEYMYDFSWYLQTMNAETTGGHVKTTAVNGKKRRKCVDSDK